MSARYYSRRRAGGLLAAALFVAVFLGITLVMNAAGDAPALAAPASGPVAAESVSVPLAAGDGDGAADLRALLPGGAGGGAPHSGPHPAPRRPAAQSAPGLTIVKESGWRDGRGRTTEAGGTASFTVRLATQPDHFVLVQFPSSDTGEGDAKVIWYITGSSGNRTVKHPHIVFKPSSYDVSGAPTGLVRDWDQATRVTVTGQDDTGDDGDVEYTVTVRAECPIVRNSDPQVRHSCGYGSVASVILPFTNADDDLPEVSPSPAPSPGALTAGPSFGGGDD